jgi:hypothetical protein
VLEQRDGGRVEGVRVNAVGDTHPVACGPRVAEGRCSPGRRGLLLVPVRRRGARCGGGREGTAGHGAAPAARRAATAAPRAAALGGEAGADDHHGPTPLARSLVAARARAGRRVARLRLRGARRALLARAAALHPAGGAARVGAHDPAAHLPARRPSWCSARWPWACCR